MKFEYRNFLHTFGVVVLLALASVSVAHAEDDDDDERSISTNAQWQTECSACHVAYPPRLLPPESWRAIMSGLNKHFGSDASLDSSAAKEIGQFLDKNAGRSSRTGKVELRITETRWFNREHDEISTRTWSKVKSRANCAACHTQAESGNYSERNIHIPR